jgi:hypothetical protein
MMKSNLKKSGLVFGIAMSMAMPATAVNQWVGGNVSVISDYSAYDGGFGVLITLTNKISQPNGDGLADALTLCTDRFRLQVGNQGIDENSKNRIFSLLLSAKMAQQKVWLYVNKANGNPPYCAVQIAAIGDTPG